MTRLNISLPESMRKFVEEQVRGGDYDTPSDYVRTLIREAQVRAAKQELESKLIEGLERGPATPMTSEEWDELKRRVWEREKKGRNPRILLLVRTDHGSTRQPMSRPARSWVTRRRGSSTEAEMPCSPR